MICIQVQNFAARWQQWGVLTIASIVRNHIISLEQLINHNIHIDMSACRQFYNTKLSSAQESSKSIKDKS